MNGRVYDPVVGRFMAADPFVDGPDNSQGYNRMSYVRNNPGSFLDPSGFGLTKNTEPPDGQNGGLIWQSSAARTVYGGAGYQEAWYIGPDGALDYLGRIYDSFSNWFALESWMESVRSSAQGRDAGGGRGAPHGDPDDDKPDEGNQTQEPQEQQQPCSAFASAVLDFTGGKSNQNIIDDVVDNFVTTKETSVSDLIAGTPGLLDFDLSTVPEWGISLYYGGKLAGVWGGVTPFQGLHAAIQSRGAAVRIPGAIGFRTPLSLATTAGVTWASNAFLLTGVYNAGVLTGSTIRTGVNRAAAATCGP
jgi:hypothetical protein